jgi:hypothetical protein
MAVNLQGSTNPGHGAAWELGYDDGKAGAAKQQFNHDALDAEYAAGYEYGEIDRAASEHYRETAELRQWAQGG